MKTAREQKQSGRRVLILATGLWVSTAQMAMALTELGCDVEIMGQRRHPAVVAGIVSVRYGYNPLRPLESMAEAIRRSRPDVLIPADELAVQHLEELREAAEGRGRTEASAAPSEAEDGLRRLLERSTGGPQVMTVGRSRVELMRVAERVGVGTPETVAVAREADLEGAIARLGLPMLLKADATSGGRGVKIVESLAEARRVWWALHRAPTAVQAARRGLVWREWTHIRPWLRGETREVSAQRLVQGVERTAMAVAHEGEIKACVCLEVKLTASVRGPSSVVQVVEDAGMVATIRKVVRDVAVSGFCGFDFMVETSSGQPLLLEMNLRPTQLVHLSLGPGRDLIAAYLRAMLGMDVADRPAATESDLIALFPKELERDPKSDVIATAFHDVPWDSPALVRWAIKPVPKVVTEDARWKGRGRA